MEIHNNVLTMQTIQIAPIRNLYSALKDLVPDVTMIIDKEGMKIINFDKNHFLFSISCFLFPPVRPSHLNSKFTTIKGFWVQFLPKS